MRVHSFMPCYIVVVALAVVAMCPGTASAYVGPGPGMEMIPYFMSLLVWAGVAMGGALLWPVSAFISRFRKPRAPTLPDSSQQPAA